MLLPASIVQASAYVSSGADGREQVDMAGEPIRVGLNVPSKPPLGDIKMAVRICRLAGLHMAAFWDHFQDFIPQSLWTEEHTWLARDRPWTHEHYDYQTLLGYLASIAGNLLLAVAVTEPQRRHPVLIAQSLMTLSHMTKRPPILGIGPGELENTIPYGVPMDQPVGRLEEALQIIRMCFTSRGPFDFDGKHFRLRNAVLDLVPEEGRTPPIWLAAHGPRMLRLTGQYGDGWLPSEVPSHDVYGDLLETIRRHARESGRDPDAITPAMQPTTILAPTDEDAREILNMRIARYVGLSLPDDVYKHYGLSHPLGEGYRGYVDVLPEELSREELEAAMDKVDPEFLAQAVLWGSPSRLASELQKYGHAGLRVVSLVPASALASRRMLNYLPRGLWRLRRLLQ